jgi:hypothetical protein
MGGGASCMYEGHIYFEEVWAQHKTYNFIDTLLGWYFTYHLVLVLAPNYKMLILSSAKLRKVCYLLSELYVKFVYLNLFGWRGCEVHETS